MTSERRKHERVSLNLLVQYRFDSVEEFLCEYAIDLSEGGMFIRTEEPAERGSSVYVQFSLKDGTKLIQGLGKVVRVTPKGGKRPAGMGVEFTSFDEDSRVMLRTIVDQRIAQAHSQPE